MHVDLLDKVKTIKGENFVTIEGTIDLSHTELIDLISFLMNQDDIKKTKIVNIQVDNKFKSGVHELLESHGFHLHDETISFYKELIGTYDKVFDFPLRSLEDITEEEFKDIWLESMKDSLNSPSSLSIDEQMRSVKVELDPDYKKSCMAAYENNQPIGIIIPHIEPGTNNEGRLFYFGLVTKVRGKGKGVPLHRQALNLLKNDFKAKYYLGSTSQKNSPMIKIFEQNGCSLFEQNKVYKKTNQKEK
ncbi:GNAT family N-acetyltransferase [Lysinibacillus sphaericus]